MEQPALQPAVAINGVHFRQAIWETYYDSYFQELMSEALGGHWEKVDGACGILVAITASGSAVAGWALWATPGGRPIWAVIAAVSSIVAIVHGGLHVAERVKRWADLRRTYGELRVQLDTLRWNVIMQGPSDDHKKRFDVLRDEFARLVGEAPNDMANTEAARERVQHRLDELLHKKGVIE